MELWGKCVYENNAKKKRKREKERKLFRLVYLVCVKIFMCIQRLLIEFCQI